MAAGYDNITKLAVNYLSLDSFVESQEPSVCISVGDMKRVKRKGSLGDSAELLVTRPMRRFDIPSEKSSCVPTSEPWYVSSGIHCCT
jgi:hypothetical protein